MGSSRRGTTDSCCIAPREDTPAGLTDMSIPVVVLTGTIGVGKTAIAMTMSEILHDLDVRHALLEVDWLGEVYPAPFPDDPYSTRFAMRNLAAIWPNFLEVGITRAIVTMTLE